MDGRLIFLHHHGRSEVRQDAFWKAIILLDGCGPLLAQGDRGHLRFRSRWNERQEKPTLYNHDVRTKTDTGRRDEYSKALERTLVKELCKLTP